MDRSCELRQVSDDSIYPRSFLAIVSTLIHAGPADRNHENGYTSRIEGYGDDRIRERGEKSQESV